MSPRLRGSVVNSHWSIVIGHWLDGPEFSQAVSCPNGRFVSPAQVGRLTEWLMTNHQ